MEISQRSKLHFGAAQSQEKRTPEEEGQGEVYEAPRSRNFEPELTVGAKVSRNLQRPWVRYWVSSKVVKQELVLILSSSERTEQPQQKLSQGE